MVERDPKDLLPTAESPAPDDYLLLDGATEGIRKILTRTAVAASRIDVTEGAAGGVERPLTQILASTISVKDFGAVGDGTTADNFAFQAAALACDEGKASYIFIPNYDETYLLTEPMVVRYADIKIFGVKAAGYQRGATGGQRKGNVLIGGDAPYAFDLGDEAASGTVPTGQWNIANIGIRQAEGTANRTKHGIALTSKHNGPHRGAIFRECSAIGLLSAIYIPDPEVTTAVANLIVENCCLSNNSYAVLSEGNVIGLRFVGNQAEQNAIGAIHGSFTSGIFIADNMLEGQPNTINISAYSIGNRPKIVVERNYFELNSGSYVIQVSSTTNDSEVTIRDNYRWNIPEQLDYLRIHGSQKWFVEMLDPRPVTHTTATTIRYGSRFLERRQYFQLRPSSPLAIQYWHPIKEFQNLIDTDETHEHVTFSDGPEKATPFGIRHCRVDDDLIDIPIAAEVGDLVSINVLCKIGDEEVTPELLNQSDQSIALADFSRNFDIDGRWCLLAIGLRVAAHGATALKFRLGDSETAVIAGVAVKNYGPITTDSSTRYDIYPVTPNL